MFHDPFGTDKLPRYERQIKNVNHLVINTLEKKNIYLSTDQLSEVLDVLYEYRVIE